MMRFRKEAVKKLLCLAHMCQEERPGLKFESAVDAALAELEEELPHLVEQARNVNRDIFAAMRYQRRRRRSPNA